MNYQQIYNNIIESAKHKTYDGYTERHHIVPKCLGGDDNPSNIIQLSAREHFLCHLLLAKQHNIRELWYAFFMMKAGNQNHDRINSRLFERYKEKRSEMMSGKNNPMYGKKSACKSHTPETIEKIRQSKLGKKRKPFKRSFCREETKAKLKAARAKQGPTTLGKVYDKVTCPHCGKEGGGGNMKRYHFDNCKLRR